MEGSGQGLKGADRGGGVEGGGHGVEGGSPGLKREDRGRTRVEVVERGWRGGGKGGGSGRKGI